MTVIGPQLTASKQSRSGSKIEWTEARGFLLDQVGTSSGSQGGKPELSSVQSFLPFKSWNTLWSPKSKKCNTPEECEWWICLGQITHCLFLYLRTGCANLELFRFKGIMASVPGLSNIQVGWLHFSKYKRHWSMQLYLFPECWLKLDCGNH